MHSTLGCIPTDYHSVLLLRAMQAAAQTATMLSGASSKALGVRRALEEPAAVAQVDSQ